MAERWLFDPPASLSSTNPKTTEDTMVTSSASQPLQSAEQKNDARRRFWSNFLNMWHVCANTACQRARCCRGKPSACFTQNFSQLPEGVQDFFILLDHAKKEGLPFDEARAELT